MRTKVRAVKPILQMTAVHDLADHNIFSGGTDLEDDLPSQLHRAIRTFIEGPGEEIGCPQKSAGGSEELAVEGVEDIQLQLHAYTFGDGSCLKNTRIQIVEGLSAECISAHSGEGIVESVSRGHGVQGVGRRRIRLTCVRQDRAAAGYSQNELIEIVVAVGSTHHGIWIGRVGLKSLERREWLAAVESIHGIDGVPVCHLGKKAITMDKFRNLVHKAKCHDVRIRDTAHAPLGQIGIQRILRKLQSVSSGAGGKNFAGIVDGPAVGVLQRSGQAVKRARGHIRLKAVVVREGSIAYRGLKRAYIAVQSLKSRSGRVWA